MTRCCHCVSNGISSSCSSCYSISDYDTDITWIRGNLKTIASFQRWTLWTTSKKHTNTSSVPKFPTWLVENIWFTQILPPLWLGGPKQYSALAFKFWEGHPSEQYCGLRQLNLGVPMGFRSRPWVEDTSSDQLLFASARFVNNKFTSFGLFQTCLHCNFVNLVEIVRNPLCTQFKGP